MVVDNRQAVIRSYFIRKRHVAAVICALLAALWPGSADAAIIGITQNQVRTEVVDVDGPDDVDVFTGTGIPNSFLLQSNGASSNQFANVLLTYSDSGSQALLDHAFELSRQGQLNDYSSVDGSLQFIATANTSYLVAGNIAVNDVGATSGDVYLRSDLWDLTTNTLLYQSISESVNTADESLTLGLAGGDFNNSFTGSLSGSLVAGHTYQWFTYAYIYGYPDSDTGATATGSFTLTLGESVPTPEPATLAIWGGLCIAGLIAARRRRRRGAYLSPR